MDDVIIVGGSFAGLSAALQLGRARRQVTVLDTGLNRNRFAREAHSLLGHDGRSPRELLQLARGQLAAYPTVRLVDARAEHAGGTINALRVETDAGPMESRRLILSYGVTDMLPPIEGLRECWGRSVLHCPYCHGFEFARQRWGLLYAGPMSLHAVTLYGDWTDRLTVFLDGQTPASEEREALLARGVQIVEGKVASLRHGGGMIEAVALDDGREHPVDALFAHFKVRPSAELHLQLGLALEEGFAGPFVRVDERQATSVPGVFAAGDLSRAMHALSFAAAGGNMAGVGAHQSLLFPAPPA
jgi:thioredoxin reductase